MVTRIELEDITVEVVKKNIKNIYLRVRPPSGDVRISAPLRMKLDAIRVFAVSKLDWIRRRQEELRERERETQREYLNGESHYVWGKRYLLEVTEGNGAPSLELGHGAMRLRVHAGASDEKKQAVVEEWRRKQLKQAVPSLIAKWGPLMGVKVERFFVRKMKTRWGSCNPVSRSIRLNTDLAGKPPECLEYVVVHEMAHLLEPSHNARFTAFMDRFLPGWRSRRAELNRLPVRRTGWAY